MIVRFVICVLLAQAVVSSVSEGTATPPVLPPQYVSRMAWVSPAMMSSIFVEEFYDGLTGIISVKTTGQIESGQEILYIRHNDTSQVLVIKDGECQIMPMNATFKTAMAMYTTKNNSTAEYFTLHDLFQSTNISFVMNERVADIPALKFNGMFDTDVGEMKVTFFMTNSSIWRNPWSGHQSVPIKIDMRNMVTGTQMYYDIVEFRSQLTNEVSAFQIPDGVQCLGLTPHKTFPKISDSYSYKSEVIDFYNKMVSSMNVWYHKSHLVRFDFTPLPMQSASSTEIHDLKGGVTYTITHDSGQCMISPLMTRSPGSGKFVSNVDPRENILFTGNTTYYMGQHMVRDMKTDAWIQQQMSGSILNTREWYFTAENWEYVEFTGKTRSNPIRMTRKMTQGSSSVEFTHNIYEYNANDNDLSAFDVQTCYKANNMRHFQFSMEGPMNKVALYPDIFRTDTQLFLMYYGNITGIRIQNLQIDYDNTTADVRFSLLGLPDLRPIPGSTYHGGLGLSEAANILKTVINSGNFIVDMVLTTLEPVENWLFQSKSDSLHEVQTSPDGSIIWNKGVTSTTAMPSSSSTSPSTVSKMTSSASHTANIVSSPTTSSSFKNSTIKNTQSSSAKIMSNTNTLAWSSKVHNTPAPVICSTLPYEIEKGFPHPGWSTGALSGLCLVMVIVGISLGIVGSVIYNRRRTYSSLSNISMKDF